MKVLNVVPPSAFTAVTVIVLSPFFKAGSIWILHEPVLSAVVVFTMISGEISNEISAFGSDIPLTTNVGFASLLAS